MDKAAFFQTLARRAAPMLARAAPAMEAATQHAVPAMEGVVGKVAPTLKNNAMNLAGSVARGVFGVGAKAGATRTMNAVRVGTGVAMTAAPLAASAFASHPQPGMTVTAAYDAGRTAAAKFAGLGPRADHLMELGGLGVLAGAPLYDMLAPEQFKQDHPHVGHALDLAGLGILAVPAARGLMAHGSTTTPPTLARRPS
jgi:hypothetical protein